jgi:hypothetical protein
MHLLRIDIISSQVISNYNLLLKQYMNKIYDNQLFVIDRLMVTPLVPGSSNTTNIRYSILKDC